MTHRAVFLDRDGVLNHVILRDRKPYPPATVSEVVIHEGVREALRELKDLGFLLIVVTNQPDVARGTTTKAEVEQIHSHMGGLLPVDEFRACYHDSSDACACRKPRPGMLLDAAREHGIDLGGSYMVGDRWRDVEAGESAGCVTVWIDPGYDERGPASAPGHRALTPGAALAWILARERAPGQP